MFVELLSKIVNLLFTPLIELPLELIVDVAAREEGSACVGKLSEYAAGAPHVDTVQVGVMSEIRPNT